MTTASPLPEMRQAELHELEAMDFEALTKFADDVGVGYEGLDKEGLLKELIFEGTEMP